MIQDLWQRPDWPDDFVGAVYGMVVTRQVTDIPGLESPLVWKHVAIDRLELERRAALLVMQGLRLNDLLCSPGSSVHMVIGCREWAPHHVPPALIGLQLARLDVVPDGVSHEQVLAALAEHSKKYST